MLRLTHYLVPVLALMAGCMRPSMSGPPQKQAPAPEMVKLDVLVGTWSGSAEMTEPDPEKMRKIAPDFKSTFVGGYKVEKTMGGMALKWEGWYEMDEGQKVNYVDYWTWDAKKGKFRTSMVNDWGEAGTGWATPCDDCNGYKMVGASVDADGRKSKVKGCFMIVDNNTLEWNFTMRGPMGKMAMRGTDKRQK